MPVYFLLRAVTAPNNIPKPSSPCAATPKMALKVSSGSTCKATVRAIRAMAPSPAPPRCCRPCCLRNKVACGRTPWRHATAGRAGLRVKAAPGVSRGNYLNRSASMERTEPLQLSVVLQDAKRSRRPAALACCRCPRRLPPTGGPSAARAAAVWIGTSQTSEQRSPLGLPFCRMHVCSE